MFTDASGVEKREKFRTSTGFEVTLDLTILVRCSNQLSYEATDIGSWSFVGSNDPMMNESMSVTRGAIGKTRIGSD